MGKYDWIFQSNDIAVDILTSEEAVAAIAVVSFSGAYSLANIDVNWLVDILSGFEIFEFYSHTQLWQMVDKLVATAATEGVGALFNAASEVLTDNFTLDGFAAGVSVLIDTENITIPRPHLRLLKQLQISLEITDAEAEQVMEDVLTAFEVTWDETEANVDENENEEELTPVIPGMMNSSSEIYTSPLGNFSLPMPVDMELGGKIQVHDGAIAFTDAQGLFLRIDYYPIPREFHQQIAICGREKYFQTLLYSKYIPQVILANIPDSSVEYTEFCPDIFAGGYFVVMKMPKGSHLCQQNSQGIMVRLNAYRGFLAFDFHQFFYVVTSQFSYTEDESVEDIIQESTILKQEILGFLATIHFH